jgi:hypothetical protein
MIVDWVEGETAPRDFILKEDGVVFDLTGLTVTLEVYDKAGVLVDTTGDLTVVTPSAGRVRYTPDATDLVSAKSELKVRFKVSDALGGYGYFPRGERDVWRVWRP